MKLNYDPVAHFWKVYFVLINLLSIYGQPKSAHENRKLLFQYDFDTFNNYPPPYEEPKTVAEREALLERYKIIPDVVRTYPKHVVEVEYPNARVNFGNYLLPNETAADPKCSWPVEENERYVLLMIDPDGDRQEVYNGVDWQFYLVTNIMGTNLTGAEMISDYIPPFPAVIKDYHRYIFLVYKQPNHGQIIEYYEHRCTQINDHYRKLFRSRVFASRYGLGEPIAINFFFGEQKCDI